MKFLQFINPQHHPSGRAHCIVISLSWGTYFSPVYLSVSRCVYVSFKMLFFVPIEKDGKNEKCFQDIFLCYWNENDEWIRNIAVVSPATISPLLKNLLSLIVEENCQFPFISLGVLEKTFLTTRKILNGKNLFQIFSIYFLSAFNSNNVAIFPPLLLQLNLVLNNHLCVKMWNFLLFVDNLNSTRGFKDRQ